MGLRLNDQRQEENPTVRAKKFFSQLPRSVIIQLYHAYKIDFDMFGYDEPKEYIEMGYILPDESNEIGPPKRDPRRPNLHAKKKWTVNFEDSDSLDSD